MDDVDKLANTLLEYLRLDMRVQKADLLIGMGTLDSRIADRTAQLFLDGFGERIVFTGGLGKLTKLSQTQTEAKRFRDIAVGMGVPESKIWLEEEATNSGENIIYVQKLLKEKGFQPRSLLIVTKPYMERRVWAAYKKQWEDKQVEIIVTSPQISYHEHYNEIIPKDLFINVMVGDLQRIKIYAEQGFQVKQDIPKEVWAAYESLVNLGYTDYVS